jgi:hypothetical protein
VTLRSDYNYSDATDSFGAGCFADTGRAAATRRAAFFRRKYAIRRLRLIRTLCCCPMHLYGLKIAETQSALKPILLFQRRVMVGVAPPPCEWGEDLGERLESPRRNQSKNPHPPFSCEREATSWDIRSGSLDERTDT